MNATTTAAATTVTTKRYRSAITGRFVKAAQALKHAAITVAETVKLKKKAR